MATSRLTLRNSHPQPGSPRLSNRRQVSKGTDQSEVIASDLHTSIVSAIAMYAQEPDESSPSTSQAPTHQDKPARNSKETRRQLQRLAYGPENIHHRRWTVQGATALPEQPADKALNYVIR